MIGSRNAVSGMRGWMAVSLLLGLGCGSEKIVIPERDVTPLDLSTVGSLSGRALFEGIAPARGPIPMGGYPACAGAHDTPPLAESVIVHEGRLKDVFVWVREGLEGRVFPIPDEPVVIDQKGCIYTPHVIGAQVYQPVLFLNSDSLLHNVHSESKLSRPFNFTMPVAGIERAKQFRAEEVMVHVKCDVHGWMSAYIGVVDHPYFSVTAGDGTYRIDHLPPGEYLLEAWHEVLGTRTRRIRIGEGEAAVADFTFTPR